MDTSHREHGGGNLPLEINTTVGRRQESADIRRLMESHRLVTLTGAGGIGKTRTSLHVARALRRTFADGAWFVELGSVTEGSPVAPAVLETLKVNDSSSRHPDDVLLDHLRGRHVLLVLDNCEHLLDQAAMLVDTLLHELAGVHVLASSRQALGVPGEATYGLEPLPLPDIDDGADPVLIPASTAVELFAVRANAAAPGFEITPANYLDVARLCVRLEGLPLSIELAAARLRVMTIDELLNRLDDRFRMLRGARHIGSERHQTMSATVAWSHDLCTTQERVLWRRASVFRGTFSLAAAEDVASGDELPQVDVLEALQGLVDKSVVRATLRAGEMRFSMLETIREFGAERLAGTEEADAIRQAHVRWAAGLVQEASDTWFGPRQVEVAERLRFEQSNIRAALEFCCTHPEHARTGLGIAGLPWFHWIAAGHLSEGRRWLERLLLGDSTPTPERALALGTTAFISTTQGEPERGAEAAVECEELGVQLGLPRIAAFGTHMRSLAAFIAGSADDATALFEEAAARYAACNEGGALSSTLAVQQAAMQALLGDVAGAAGRLSELDGEMEALGEQWIYSHALWIRALLHLTLGEFDEASRLVRRSIELKLPFRDSLGLALALDAYAWILAAQGSAERAAWTLGVATGIWSTIGITLFGSGFFTDRRAECEASARAALGDEAFEEEAGRGAVVPLKQALAVLLEPAGMPRRAVPSPSRRRDGFQLTRREHEVARLVAEGLSNPEIAERLVISQRTAEGHVENILRKLDFRSRTQVAAWILARPGSDQPWRS